VDEAALVSDQTYLKGLFPMIRKEPNALILISTEDHLSFLTLLKAANVKTSGYLEFSATCTTCRKDETVMECPHMKGYHSSVFAENRAVKLKELYTITNQTDIMRTELFSSGTDTSQKRFQPHLIDAFIKGRPDEELPYLDPKSTVVIGVDPGGGGRSDHIYTALVPGRQGRPVVSSFFFFFFFFFLFFSMLFILLHLHRLHLSLPPSNHQKSLRE
jgi:hypothetical protein